MITRKLGVRIVAALLTVACVACSSDDDSAADTVQESSQTTPDQTVQPATTNGADGDAGTVEGDNDSGDAPTMPDGWPEYLALPDGFTIETSQSRTMSDGRDLSLVDALGEGDPADIFATYEAAVTDAGFQIQFQNDLDGVHHLTAADDNWSVDVVVEESARFPGQTSIALKYMSKLEANG